MNSRPAVYDAEVTTVPGTDAVPAERDRARARHVAEVAAAEEGLQRAKAALKRAQAAQQRAQAAQQRAKAAFAAAEEVLRRAQGIQQRIQERRKRAEADKGMSGSSAATETTGDGRDTRRMTHNPATAA